MSVYKIIYFDNKIKAVVEINRTIKGGSKVFAPFDNLIHAYVVADNPEEAKGRG